MRKRALNMIAGLCVAAIATLGGCATGRTSCGDAAVAISTPDALSPLSEAGLYSDSELLVTAPGVVEYEPQFELWSDGATKRRFLQLPAGAEVDVSSGRFWVFPVGTRVYKEFERDGLRVETRLLERRANGWSVATYAWDAAQRDAAIVVDGVENALGTGHDIPAVDRCMACHGGTESVVLGFSAAQLSTNDQSSFYEREILSDSARSTGELPSPAREALGYLHANCSHCHNPYRAAAPVGCFDPPPDLDFTLPAGLTSPEASPALRTGQAVLGTRWGRSEVVHRMSRRTRGLFIESMPPLGTDTVDGEGVALMQRFLSGEAN